MVFRSAVLRNLTWNCDTWFRAHLSRPSSRLQKKKVDKLKFWPFEWKAKMEIDRNIRQKMFFFFWIRLEALGKCVPNHVLQFQVKIRKNAVRKTDFVSRIVLSSNCIGIFCAPYLLTEKELSDEMGIDRFSMPQKTLTPSFSGIRSTTVSGFRLDFSIDISSGVTGIYAYLICNFSTKKTLTERIPTPTNAVQTQTHSCKIWRRNTSKQLRKRLLSENDFQGWSSS